MRVSFADERLTKLLTALTAAAEFAVCASDILLAPMLLEALTLHRVITLPKELSARSAALVLEFGTLTSTILSALARNREARK